MKYVKPIALGLASIASGVAGHAQDAARPNIVIIMADQLRADIFGREGYPLETTPSMDRLARQGTWFDRAYTAAPASAPARVSMLTGRFPSATHVKSNHNIPDAYYTQDLFDVARESGYRTALIGKNHSHLTPDRTDYWNIYDHDGQRPPLEEDSPEAGFDRFLRSLSMYTSLEPSPGGVETQQPYRMVGDATQWIGSLDGDPFLLWMSIPEPHNPYQVCEPYYSMFPPESLPPMTIAADRKVKGAEYEQLAEMMALGHVGYEENLQRLRSIYLGMTRMIDDQIGRLMDNLMELGVYDNTIIVFISDHGDFAGEYGLMKKGVGLDDCLVRIPMQWTGPGIAASSAPHKAHVSIVDIFPTACEIMGAEIPAGVQGRSLWPLLTGQPYPGEEFSAVMAQDGYGGMYYTKEDSEDYIGEGAVRKEKGFFDELNTWSQSGTMRMLRSGDWKLVYDMDGNGLLYNLAKDPSEMNNLFGSPEYAGIRNQLIETLLRWEISTADPLPLPRARYWFKSNPHNYLFKE